GCSPEIMEKIKNDIINVISKYIEIDVAGLDIKIQQTEGENGEGLVPVLFANIPVKEIRRG
ncbi:MAG: cell division topological specificity factor MinE, partial [Lachnospiraceae bacterium]|nr:cell division topological specificity factor MinE [Lachnospiraceae bacterium]